MLYALIIAMKSAHVTMNSTNISWVGENLTNITKETLQQWNHDFFIIQIPVLIVLSVFLVTGILGNGSVIYT